MKLTKEQAVLLFKTNQMIMLLARGIEHEYWVHHKEFPLSANANNHAKRIRESAERIQQEVNFILRIKDRDLMDEHVYEIMRLLKSFLTANTKELREFNDSLEADTNEIKKVQVL